MKGFFCRLLNILPGQEKNAFLFATLGFMWSFACNCAYKYSEVLFLINVGAEQLPTIYKIVSTGMVGLAVIMLFALHRITAFRLFNYVIAIGIAFYVLIFFTLFGEITAKSYWLWYSLRIFGYLFWCVIMTSYWTLVDQHHCLAAAKRHFCLYSASIFLGVASAGVLMRSGLMSLFQVLTLVLISLFCIYLWVNRINRMVPAPTVENHGQDDEEIHFSPLMIFKEICKSRYTILFLVGNFVTLLMWVITEYNYMSTFEARFAPEDSMLVEYALQSELAHFLGSCVAIAGAVNIFFGMILYSRLINRFGIGILLMLCPTLFLITYIGWQFDTSLLFPLMGYFIVEGTLSVVDDNNFNLMLKSFHPKLKYTIRIMTEYFFEPLGMLMTGILLSFPYINNKLIGLGLAAISFVISFTLVRLYLQSVKITVTKDRLHLSQSIVEIWDWILSYTRCAEKQLLKVLHSEDRQLKRLAKENLRRLEDEEPILYRMLKQADHLTSAGKVRFISIMEKSAYAQDQELILTFESWFEDTNDQDLKDEISIFFNNQGISRQAGGS